MKRKTAKKFVSICISALVFLCACGSTNKAKTEMPNPITEYSTCEEAEAAVGFKALYLTKDTGYDAHDIMTISNEVIDVEFINRDSEQEITVRTGKGNNDISGVYGITYTEQEINDVAVQVGMVQEDDETTCVAWWSEKNYCYSCYTDDVDGDTFLSLVEVLVDTSKTLQN